MQQRQQLPCLPNRTVETQPRPHHWEKMAVECAKIKRVLCMFRVQLLCVSAVLLFLPLPICLPEKPFLCLFVVLIMGILWTTETLPLQITALIPVFAYPYLGVVPAEIVSREYFNKINLVFLGVLLLAIAVQSSGLHERIALRILLFTGTSPLLLMLGIQLAAAFLSMWITNGAVTAMMLPIVLSIIARLEQYQQQKCGSTRSKMSSRPALTPICADGRAGRRQRRSSIADLDLTEIDPKRATLYKGLLLSICYASSIGGIGTLIGTTPNLVFARIVKTPGQEDPISFVHWSLFAVPASALMLLFCWLWLGWLFVGFDRQKKENGNQAQQKAIHRMLQQKYTALGPMKHAEIVVLCIFFLQLALWSSRPALWGRWFGVHHPNISKWEAAAEEGATRMECARPKVEEYVHDSTVAILMAFLLFVLPSQNPFQQQQMHTETSVEIKPILTWEDVHKRFDWQTLLLMGGSFAMAKGVECSGLSVLIGRTLDLPLLQENPMLFVGFACVLATFLTEFSSNTATCTILLTTLKGMAEQDPRMDLIRYGLPLTISCSFAFMLPAGTPPNAIVFGSGLLRVLDMVKAGFLLNFFGLVVVVTLANFYAPLIFGPVNLADDEHQQFGVNLTTKMPANTSFV